MVFEKIKHGTVIRNLLVADIHKTGGTHQSTTIGGCYLDTEGSSIRDITIGEQQDSHHIYSKHFVIFLQW